MPLNKPRVALIFVFLFSCFLAAKADAQAGASFSLSPSTGVCIPGGTFDLDIILNTDEPSSGATAIIHYPSNTLEVLSVSPGDIFPMPLVNSVKENTIRLDMGVNPADPQYFSGEGVFGAIKFKVLSKETTGSASVPFIFYEGSTKDSNVAHAETHQDILTSVTDGFYTIQDLNNDPSLDPSCASSTPTPTPTPTTPPGAPTPTPTTPPGATPTPTTASSAPTPTPTTPPGATPTTPPADGGAPEGGILGPTIFLSLLSLLMIWAGLILK